MDELLAFDAMPRLREPEDPVTVYLDGEPLTAERGEPVAVALVASRQWALARSPKYHRPRGPACLRGGCDGCFARVDGVPNVMTCRLAARDGMRIERQNALGGGESDLLRIADWLFPNGLNHHEVMAGVYGVRRLVPVIARRVAGIGRLPSPDAPSATSEARATATRTACDVLVIGAGPSGMAAALELAGRGRAVDVVDADLVAGGSLGALPGTGGARWAELATRFARAIADPIARVRLRLSTTAAGIYGDDVLLATDAAVSVVTARTLVLAPGAHDGALAFEGNDLPGVLSARAACRLLAHGVAVGEQVVVIATDPESPFASALANAHHAATVGTAATGALAGHLSVRRGSLGGRARSSTAPRATAGDSALTLIRGVPIRASGGRFVREVTVATSEGHRRLRCDALVIDAARSAAYELCAQAGADVSSRDGGRGGDFVVRTAAGGEIRDGVIAVGEAVGTPFDVDAVLAEAAALRA